MMGAAHVVYCIQYYMFIFNPATSIHCSCIIFFQGFLYKCLGVVMRKTTHKQFVQNSLEMMFGTVKHTSQEEREVCIIEYTVVCNYFMMCSCLLGMCYWFWFCCH